MGRDRAIHIDIFQGLLEGFQVLKYYPEEDSDFSKWNVNFKTEEEAKEWLEILQKVYRD